MPKISPITVTTAASLVNRLMEERSERRLLKLQRDRQAMMLLVVAELGYVPLSPIRAEKALLSDRAKAA